MSCRNWAPASEHRAAPFQYPAEQGILNKITVELMHSTLAV